MWTCKKCEKPVYFAERVQSLGDSWHPTCLTCRECGKKLHPGQHADHVGDPYCHHPCYGALFGPRLFGHGTRNECHRAFGKRDPVNSSTGEAGNTNTSYSNNKTGRANGDSSEIASASRSQLEGKLREFNKRFEGKPEEITKREVNGRLVLEGLLRIHWGGDCVIYLKEDDTNSPVMNARRKFNGNVSVGSKVGSDSSDDNCSSDTSEPLWRDEEENNSPIRGVEKHTHILNSTDSQKITDTDSNKSQTPELTDNNPCTDTDYINISQTDENDSPTATSVCKNIPNWPPTPHPTLSRGVLSYTHHAPQSSPMSHPMPEHLDIDWAQVNNYSDNLNTFKPGSDSYFISNNNDDQSSNNFDDGCKTLRKNEPKIDSDSEDGELFKSHATMKLRTIKRNIDSIRLEEPKTVDNDKDNNLDNNSINNNEGTSSNNIFSGENIDDNVKTMKNNSISKSVSFSPFDKTEKPTILADESSIEASNKSSIQVPLQSSPQPQAGSSPQLPPTKGRVVLRRRPPGRRMNKSKVKRRCSINGHSYLRSTSSFRVSSVTPPAVVRVTSLTTAARVVASLLDKYKIEMAASSFAIYVVRDNGEQKRLPPTSRPLETRVLLGPHDSVARLVLARIDCTREVTSEVAQFVRLSLTECRAILRQYDNEEETKLRQIKARYDAQRSVVRFWLRKRQIEDTN